MSFISKIRSSLRLKLISMIMAISILGLTVFGGVFYFFETNSYQNAMVQKLEVLSKVIASRTTAAILFDDEMMLKENLQSLLAYEAVTSAVILDVDKKVLSQYGKTPENREFFKVSDSLKAEFLNDFIYFSEPIVIDNERIGTLVLKASLDELKSQQKDILQLGIVLLGFMILLSYVVTLKFQGIISNPILELTQVAKQIDQSNDYSLRPNTTSSDEIGVLADALSSMLKTIEEKNRLLQHELNRSEMLSEQLIDSIPLSVVVSGYDGTILRANTQALKEYNVKAEDIDTYNIMDFYVHQSDRENVIETIQSVGYIKQRIVSFKDLSGLERKVMLSVIPIEYDLQKALLSIAVDITQRIEMEEALIEARNRADAANRSKSEFLANMSHEIRTPMNAILGFTELLNEQLAEPRLLSYVKTIQSAGNTLLMLINDILDLSKIEAGKMELQKQPVNLHDFFEEIGSVFSMTMRNKGLDLIINVETSLPKSLLIDEVRLRQIFFNLLGNAVKFTQDGFIKIQLKALNADQQNSKLDLDISVQDSGIGIAQDQLTKIFNTFEQTEGQDNRQFGGTGLGLSISKRLCEMMGGKILVESTQGVGTTFRVQLFDVDISSVVPQQYTSDKMAFDARLIRFKPAKVLIVDDIEDNRELIVKNFEDTAIETVTANDGIEAIEQYKSEKPDLILMDIRMPNMDGYEAAAQIKKLANVPIIALTASVMQDEYERLKRENFDGYLQKPVLRYDLFSELSNFLLYEKSDIFYDSEKEKFILSDKAKLNIDTILNILHNEISPLHQQALKSNNIADMKIMASRIHSLALEYKIDLLQRYASELYEAIDAFDISKMEQLLQNFSEIEKELGS